MTDGHSVGRTRWGTFALVLLGGVLGSALLLVGVARGAIPVSFTVSGTDFKVSGDRLEGEGMVLYGDVDQGTEAAHPVARTGFRHVVVDNFCQSVLIPDLPLVGDVTLRMTSPGPASMEATDMVVGVGVLSGDMTLGGANIGVDAAHLSKGPLGVVGSPGDFGMQADKAVIVAPRQIAWSTLAHTLRLKSLTMTITAGRNECF